MQPDNFIDTALYHIDTAILGEKVLVRRLREGDGLIFYDLMAENSSLISEYFPVLIHDLSTKEGAEFFVRKTIIQWLLQQSFGFGIWDKEKLNLVGYIDISRRMPEKIGELRFFIDKNRMGEGLMSDTLQVMIPYFFNQLLLDKITIKGSTENYTLPTLARKFGFLREGELRGEIYKQSGDRGDVWVYGLLRNMHK
ncbi:MAG: GNAT family N-acetyltransferase [Bacteroidetes bacterium]|nr:GNAT family N-acetyltransferase [Bacteroidota bacterium]